MLCSYIMNCAQKIKSSFAFLRAVILANQADSRIRTKILSKSNDREILQFNISKEIGNQGETM